MSHMKNKIMIRSTSAEFLIFDRQIHKNGIELRFEDGDLWLSQNSIGELYNTSKQNISYHLINIFKDNELQENSVVKEYLTTASDGKKYRTNYYNLDAVISVGYRVNSDRTIQFRRWATNILKGFSKKGYIIDKKRMENDTFFDEAYTFFKIVQNKLHYAITGYTTAELIYERVDSEKIHSGLTNWKNSPDGKIMKYDISITKNRKRRTGKVK